MNFMKNRLTKILGTGTSLLFLAASSAQSAYLFTKQDLKPEYPLILTQGTDGAGGAASQNLQQFIKEKQEQGAAGGVTQGGGQNVDLNQANQTPAPEAPAVEIKPLAPAAPAQEAKPLVPAAPAQEARPEAPAQPASPAPKQAENPKGNGLVENPIARAPREPAPPSATAPDEPRKVNPIARQPEQPKERNPIAKAPGKPQPGVSDGTSGTVVTAPLTDSGKEDLLDHLRKKGGDDGTRVNPRAKFEDPNGPKINPIARAPAPLPPSDRAAQDGITIKKIDPVDREKGRRINDERPVRPGSLGDVIERIGDRLIIRLDNGGLSVITEDRRDRRIHRRAEEVYTEELPGGLLRETVIRPNGVRIITVYNEYGYVVRRSRIDRDGYETILVYVPREYWDELGAPDYDPGADLPPLVLDMPREDYILEAERADRDDYREFLDRAPVERVERLYSVDEVVRSARIRDKVRRIDLDTITFETGSAEISESEVDELQALGDAMLDILDQNPGEVFLIEGHTDAVGSEAYNLVLSDKRAETVADVMTGFFKIPPENLVTQGYGETYLKIRTLEAERENRRVAVRRITPLVAPAGQQVTRR